MQNTWTGHFYDVNFILKIYFETEYQEMGYCWAYMFLIFPTESYQWLTKISDWVITEQSVVYFMQWETHQMFRQQSQQTAGWKIKAQLWQKLSPPWLRTTCYVCVCSFFIVRMILFLKTGKEETKGTCRLYLSPEKESQYLSLTSVIRQTIRDILMNNDIMNTVGTVGAYKWI